MPPAQRILRALRGEPVDRTPVWFMRQAGRTLPRYREARAERGFFEIIRDPRAAAEITAMPLDYYPVDACVLYNDLVTPFFGAGLEVELRSGVGPVVDRPVEEAADVGRLRPFDPRDALDYVLEQIRLLTRRLDVPILAFVGAPFTLCSYLVRAPRSRDLRELKAFIWEEPGAWSELADFWAEHLADFAVAQHEAGAAAVQVFDSWAGILSVDDYRAHVLPHSRKLMRILDEAEVPSIHFFTGNPALLPSVAEAGGTAVSVDWRIPLDEAREIIGPDRPIQGNLDPAALLAGAEVAVAKAREVVDRAGGRPGHIFNLGHGLHPETDHRVVRAVVDAVHGHVPEPARTAQGTA
ncbi:MAG: uroporphyrinogen decarboxylase [Gemmatimonadetes bacterium]|nr:uroporphyrinogen decarboxylase [Gemmatimonadota bacterium]NIR79471.1 uroporphyrinogen decarboxylase [Gemmatimonadota bacterium]NIT88142.1 uroporphyrinogen decarboxylase [Gemmatimonadota bacterium]NIU31963.1 uroporphyrinogen decarboxylase [Gemmatimonadota bacterium]NIU36575.1 uroporphyrinogen decarboxylase [Gemmatimonadota bacterium]